MDGNCLMIEITGRLHDSGFGTLRELILETMAQQSCDLTLLDLSQAQNTCSLLLQTMVRADRQAQADGRQFAVIALPGSLVEERLLLSKMDRMITLAPDPASARRLTAGGGSSTS